MRAVLKHIVVALLTIEARAVLRRRRPRIVAVTGSVGKTTTKDAIYAAVSGHIAAGKSAKSFNSELGVPLAVLQLENAWGSPWGWVRNLARGLRVAFGRGDYPRLLVLEVGADRPGDIRAVARWLRPDIAVITAVPDVPVHVEYFDSPEAVLREKQSLAEFLKPGGTLLINGDDPRLSSLKSTYRGSCVAYGIDPSNDFYASHIEVAMEEGMPEGVRFRINADGLSLPISVHGALGLPRVYGAAAAVAAAAALGVDAVAASDGLQAWDPPPGRVRIIAGTRGSVLLDDTYNSSPAAALAALDTLAGVPAKRRIAVLGDMLELGRFSAEQHRAIGRHAAEVVDLLITVGFRSRATAEAARDAGMEDLQVRSYEMGEAVRAADELQREVGEGDVILVKGSQSMRMEKAVLELMAEPEKAGDLLVRMDAAWRTR